eukprot:6186902-Pleurochrysis_carterae.AAC.5
MDTTSYSSHMLEPCRAALVTSSRTHGARTTSARRGAARTARAEAARDGELRHLCQAQDTTAKEPVLTES